MGRRRSLEDSQTPGGEGVRNLSGSSAEVRDDGMEHLEYKLRLIEAHR